MFLNYFHPFINLFVDCEFVCLFFCLFIHLFVHSFIHSFIHSFSHSFIMVLMFFFRNLYGFYLSFMLLYNCFKNISTYSSLQIFEWFKIEIIELNVSVGLR